MTDRSEEKYIPATQWEWYGYAAHFCASRHCMFRMTTVVGKYLISTVGDYHPGWQEQKETLGGSDDSFYETLVMNDWAYCDCGCKTPKFKNSHDNDEMKRWPDAVSAREGHLELCEEYASL